VLLDVRTPEEFSAGSIPGAAHAPGGQLVQATDQWVAVRNARLVLIDGEGVRAPVVASWLKQLGCDVYVLEGGRLRRVRSGPQHEFSKRAYSRQPMEHTATARAGCASGERRDRAGL
jgi:rhodanese-related sulfurtransferase